MATNEARVEYSVEQAGAFKWSRQKSAQRPRHAKRDEMLFAPNLSISTIACAASHHLVRSVQAIPRLLFRLEDQVVASIGVTTRRATLPELASPPLLAITLAP